MSGEPIIWVTWKHSFLDKEKATSAPLLTSFGYLWFLDCLASLDRDSGQFLEMKGSFPSSLRLVWQRNPRESPVSAFPATIMPGFLHARARVFVCVYVLVNVNTEEQRPPFQGASRRCRRGGS